MELVKCGLCVRLVSCIKKMLKSSFTQIKSSEQKRAATADLFIYMRKSLMYSYYGFALWSDVVVDDGFKTVQRYLLAKTT